MSAAATAVAHRPLAIQAQGVTKVFGSGTLAYKALRGVDFDVAQGELVMLVGPSGSGKTTLLSILGCVLTATDGDVTVLGERVSGRSERALPLLRRSLIGFIFQGHNLLNALSSLDNVRLIAGLSGLMVAVLTHSSVLSITVGMAVLHALQRLAG